MYKVYRNGNRSLRQTFETYEEARKAVRRLIRKTTTPLARFAQQDYFGDFTSPTIGDFGFSIKRV